MLKCVILGALLVVAAFAQPLAAANLKLYTTDGEFQVVREYHVEGDRVKFYSIDRSDWEEVPVSIVDLKRTEAELSAKQEVLASQTKAVDEEVAAARAEKAEIAKIPQNSGVYRIENGELRTFEYSQNVVHDNRPEFYFQLDNQESFGIIKLSTQKGLRIAEHIAIIPISKETEETREPVKIFTKQLPGDNFFKIWPEEPLAAGEYGVIEYVEGKIDMRIWDFRIE